MLWANTETETATETETQTGTGTETEAIGVDHCKMDHSDQFPPESR